MSNLEFAWPYAAALLILLVPMWLYDRKKRLRESYLTSPMAVALRGIVKTRGEKAWPKQINWLMVLFFSLLILALMRPQLVGEPLEVTRDGRNIMLVLDISESMEAEDMVVDARHVDRLIVAKAVINEFIDKRRGDSVGLIVFGSEAFLHAPLSFDHPTIKTFLNDAQIGFAGPKTAIGDAIGLATKKLIEKQSGDRLMVLLTDGQNNTGTLEPLQAANLAEKHKVKIYVVGLGASRMVVDGFFGPTAVNPSLSLEEAEPELRELAQKTGGKYFRAKDPKALLSIYEDIDKLEPVKSDPIVLIPRKELFYWPLVLFLILMFFRALPMVRKMLFPRAGFLDAEEFRRTS